jgi:hypothetical protein
MLLMLLSLSPLSLLSLLSLLMLTKLSGGMNFPTPHMVQSLYMESNGPAWYEPVGHSVVRPPAPASASASAPDKQKQAHQR